MSSTRLSNTLHVSGSIASVNGIKVVEA
jgi:hypothetical protein